ncbi:MAG: hypothetical protein JXB17_07900 [Bacteroidales bacterium]|nr:hypothetical protein [Bacteroidales bacterium]
MDWPLIISYSISGLSIIGLIVTNIYKIKWSNEYKAAKQAQIDALTEQLSWYKNITSGKPIEFLKQQKEDLEKIIEKHEKNIDELKKQIESNYVVTHEIIIDILEEWIDLHQKLLNSYEKQIEFLLMIPVENDEENEELKEIKK